MEKTLWQHVQTVKQKSPLVLNITNYVVMNNTANALLAAGASPIMAHAHEEVQSLAGISGSLVINIGTLSPYWVESMKLAAKSAYASNKPWILDPVGAGASSYRNDVLAELLQFRPTVIRGNASEIMALAKTGLGTTKGVDSTAQANEALGAAFLLQQSLGAVICISGEVDIIVGATGQIHLHNGNVMMTKVTGLGCSATAIIGAFIAVVPNTIEAVAAAMSLLAVSGELAAKNVQGPGSLQVALLDKLYNITEQEFFNTIRITQQ